MSDILERLRAHLDDDHQKGCEGRQYYCECGYDKEGNKLHAEAADEIKQVRAERDNWEAVCSGSLKEQFRLARENEARLKLALEQLDKAATEIERLQGVEELYKSGTKYWNPVYQEVLTERDTLRAENKRLAAEIGRLQVALREDRKYLEGLCGCAASSGCGAAIRRAEIDRLLDESLPTAEDVRGILKL